MSARTVSLVALSAFLIGSGIMHFLRPAMYVALIPPFFPAPLALVYLSGLAELALGGLVLIPRLRRWAAWGIIALLIAVFPANLYHALSGGLTDPALPAVFASSTVAWLRLPFQAVFIAWAWVFTRPSNAPR